MNNQCQTNVKADHKLITQRSETQKSKFVLSKEGHPKGSIETKFSPTYTYVYSPSKTCCVHSYFWTSSMNKTSLTSKRSKQKDSHPTISLKLRRSLPQAMLQQYFSQVSLLRSISLRSVTPYGM